MKLEDLRVMLVDEEPAMRRQVADMLRQTGVQWVREAASGEVAGLTQAFSPDVLLLGTVADRGDAIAFAGRLKADSVRCPWLILINGYGDLWRMTEARAAGVDGFLVRPFPLRTLYLRLEEAALSARSDAPASHRQLLRVV